MRFIENNHVANEPSWGDYFCITSPSTIRVYNSSNYDKEQDYREYVKLDSSFSDVVFTTWDKTYDFHRPCQGYTQYAISDSAKIISTHEDAIIVTSALLCVTIITVFVWSCVRGIFPRHLRSVR